MTAKVELVFFEGCPHAERARERVRDALLKVGHSLSWSERDTGHENTLSHYRRFASPTVLVDGLDVSGGSQGAGLGCAVGGGPTVEEIVRALQSGADESANR